MLCVSQQAVSKSGFPRRLRLCEMSHVLGGPAQRDMCQRTGQMSQHKPCTEERLLRNDLGAHGRSQVLRAGFTPSDCFESIESQIALTEQMGHSTPQTGVLAKVCNTRLSGK